MYVHISCPGRVLVFFAFPVHPTCALCHASCKKCTSWRASHKQLLKPVFGSSGQTIAQIMSSRAQLPRAHGGDADGGLFRGQARNKFIDAALQLWPSDTVSVASWPS